MRVTSQMLTSNTAGLEEKYGIKHTENSLMDYIKKGAGATSLTDVLNNSNANKANAKEKDSYTKLQDSSETISDATNKLLNEASDLYKEAIENDSTDEIIATIEDMAEGYNNALDQLSVAGGTLNTFYKSELQKLPTDYADSLSKIGITQKSDGSLYIDDKVLSAADVDSIKKAFSGDSGFAAKLNVISEHISDNADANLSSASTQYNSNGKVTTDNVMSKYDFLS